MARRRKTTYPPPKTATRGPRDPDDPRNPGGARSIAIDLSAMAGRTEIRTGHVVRIATGLYSGERAVVESVVGGVIPAALVRTEAGLTRRVRAVDLVLDPGGEAEAEPASG